MDFATARELAEMLSGEVFEIQDEVWIVLIDRPDGRLVAVSEAAVEEYADRKALEAGHCYACISLA